MSPRRRFRVVLLVGRTLSREIDAASEDLALTIAEYLYTAFGDRDFMPSSEDMVDIHVDDDAEVRT